MIRDNYLDVNKLVGNKKIFKLFRVVEQHGGVLRFVGGAVRDALKGLSGFDLDLATDLSPDELVEACTEEGLKTVPIGIKYGTVGVIIDDEVLEVTSLRRDVKTDGRHAEVEFTDNWEEDASRRDLTINAVYADEKGNVFDYYNGIEDLEKGTVRFIGSPSQRIREDYLRILRFFRFYSNFGQGPVDKKALEACRENREGLTTLSMERIRDEFAKILLTKNVVSTLRIMFENDILSFILPDPQHFDKLDFLINLVDEEELPHEAMRRLYTIYQPDKALAENLAVRLRLTKKQKQHFVSWAENEVKLEEYQNETALYRLLYRFGAEFCVDKLLLLLAERQQSILGLHNLIKKIRSMEIPEFPLRGKDIIASGVKNPHQIGPILKELEEIWIGSGFKLSKQELLDIRDKFKKVAGE